MPSLYAYQYHPDLYRDRHAVEPSTPRQYRHLRPPRPRTVFLQSFAARSWRPPRRQAACTPLAFRQNLLPWYCFLRPRRHLSFHLPLPRAGRQWEAMAAVTLVFIDAKVTPQCYGDCVTWSEVAPSFVRVYLLSACSEECEQSSRHEDNYSTVDGIIIVKRLAAACLSPAVVYTFVRRIATVHFASVEPCPRKWQAGR